MPPAASGRVPPLLLSLFRIGCQFHVWSLTEPPRWPRRRRLAVACAVGVVATLFSTYRLDTGGRGAWDFAWALNGARALLGGVDPYRDLHLGFYEAPLFYPLPTLLLAMPLSPLPDLWAAGLFVGLSSALLAFGLTRWGAAPLLTFLSFPYLWAASIGQWSILVTAAALSPWLAPLLLTKPSLGLAVLGAFPGRLALALLGIGVLLLAALTVFWYPVWFQQWLLNVQGGNHVAPILVFPGWLLVGALLYWRLPSARLLFLFACAPQWLDFYDQVLLFLMPRSPRQFAYLAAMSWAWFPVWSVFPAGHPLHLDRYVWNVLFDIAAFGLVVAQGRGWARTQWIARDQAGPMPESPASMVRPRTMAAE